MKAKLIPTALGGLLLACAGVASAAEPLMLSDSQMDAVSAGAQVSISYANASALIGVATAGTTTNATKFGYWYKSTSASGAALAIGYKVQATSASGSAIF
ncbi:MAG: hypothetical protein ACOH2B_09295 [Burkholderiaceae bacterium]